MSNWKSACKVTTILAGTLLVAACDDKIEPFALTLADVGEPEKATHAQIVFSAPRVYTRETLINDRLTEVAFLAKELARSGEVAFGPELQRELNSIQSTAISLRAGFNPAAGSAFSDNAELDGLRRDMERTQLTIQLETMQRQLDTLRKQGPADTPPSDSGGGNGNEKFTNTAQTIPDPDEALGKVDALSGAIKKLQEEFDKLKTVGALSEANSALTPEETYRRRRDHRAEIRADLAALRLDDVHGADGNALYRLQFLASVIPPSGDDKNRWGVARMKVIPPILEPDEIRSLYFDWLGHVTRRLNRVRKDEDGKFEEIASDPLHLRLGFISDLYATARVPLSAKCDKNGTGATGCQKIAIAVPNPDAVAFLEGNYNKAKTLLKCVASFSNLDGQKRQYFERILRNEITKQADSALKVYGKSDEDVSDIVTRLSKFRSADLKKALTETLPISLDKTSNGNIDKILKDEGELECSNFSPSQIYNKSLELIAIGPTITSAHRALGERLELSNTLRKDALGLLKLYDEAASNAIHLLPPYLVKFALNKGKQVPAVFCETLLNANSDKENPCPTEVAQPLFLQGKIGDSFALAVTPTDEAQRISTLQRAARAMQLSLALAATVPQSGLKLNAGVNYLKAASGSIDALERIPRVIGFAGRGPRTPVQETNPQKANPQKADPQKAMFGWLIGPEVSVDSEKNQLKLQQTAIDRTVTADISIPGWWPHMRLRVESTWAGRLEDLSFQDEHSLTQQAMSDADFIGTPRDMLVKLPRNMADLDGLTSLLFDSLGFGQQASARIDYVDPETISVCGKNVSLLIQGTELWREPRVFLDGIEARKGTVEVLPDMGGLIAKFDLENSAEQLAAAEKKHPMLSVWTRIGEARRRLPVDCKVNPKPNDPKRTFSERVASLIGLITDRHNDAQEIVVALETRLAALDATNEQVKKLTTSHTAIKAAVSGSLDKALKGPDKKSGLEAYKTSAAAIDADINTLSAEIEIAKISGKPTKALKRRIAGKTEEGTADLIEASQVKAVFDKELEKHAAALTKLQGQIDDLTKTLTGGTGS